MGEGDGELEVVDRAMRLHGNRGDALIEVLHVAQRRFGFLSPEVLAHVARGLALPLSRVYGVATFYNLFSLRPKGEHVCTVCLGTACWVRGGEAILSAAVAASGVSAGETAADGRRSVAIVRCIGACGGAPVAALDGALVGHATPDGVAAAVRGWGGP
jgi:bidirectional [NiFe] hydrogenase diaphorase subunit